MSGTITTLASRRRIRNFSCAWSRFKEHDLQQNVSDWTCRWFYIAFIRWILGTPSLRVPCETKRREVELDLQVSPEEIMSREVELDPQVSPEEIMSREVELGCESWTSFAPGCSSTAVQRTLFLWLCPSTAVETAIAKCTSRCAMARGHRLNTSIVLAAVHGLSSLFRAVSAFEPSLSLPLPHLSPSLISNLASVDVKQYGPGLSSELHFTFCNYFCFWGTHFLFSC